jgi:hypothetical protein
VEGHVRREPRARVTALHGHRLPRQGLVEAAEARGVGPARGEPGSQAIEHFPEVVQIHRFVEVQDLDPHASARQQLHEPFLLQTHERLADGRAADAELIGQVRLAKPRAVGEPTIEDGRTQRLHGVVDEATALERRDGNAHGGRLTRIPPIGLCIQDPGAPQHSGMAHHGATGYSRAAPRCGRARVGRARVGRSPSVDVPGHGRTSSAG